MKKLSRRELFRGAGATAVGGAALVFGLPPGSKPVDAEASLGSWSKEFHLPNGISPLCEASRARFGVGFTEVTLSRLRDVENAKLRNNTALEDMRP